MDSYSFLASVGKSLLIYIYTHAHIDIQAYTYMHMHNNKSLKCDVGVTDSNKSKFALKN